MDREEGPARPAVLDLALVTVGRMLGVEVGDLVAELEVVLEGRPEAGLRSSGSRGS